MSDSKIEKLSVRAAVEKHREFLFPAVTTYYSEPLSIEKGEGSYVWDGEGRKYLDCFGGVLTVSIGHQNPNVKNAIIGQLDKISHTSTLYVSQSQSDLAERLASITPGKLKKTFFTNSGTEANETALLAAKLATGRQEVIVLRHSYSGRGASVLSAVGQSTWKPIPSQVAGFTHAPAPYCYRCPFKLEYPSCDLACADDVKEIIETTTTGEIAAFMAEPILGAGGFIVPPEGYFEKIHKTVKEHGGLFISDEVQTAWGRTGEKWFGIEHWGIEPDIMTSAKGLANGAPIGWTIATASVADKLPGISFSTFGGNPVSTSAAMAVLDVIESEDLRTNAKIVGDYLRTKFLELSEKYPTIGEVRGMGLMQAIELVQDRKSKTPAPQILAKVMESTRLKGVLVGKGGLYGNVLRTGMMLNSTKSHVDELIYALDLAFSEVSGT